MCIRDRYRGQAGDKIEESPRSMLIPLMILAVLSLAGGFLAIPHFLLPELEIPAEGKLAGLVMGGLVSIAGIGAALGIYLRRPQLLERFCSTVPGKQLYRLSRRRFYVDEIYQVLIVRPLNFLAEAAFYLLSLIHI